MYQFLESIWIENGELKNIDLHQQRLNATYQYHFHRPAPFELKTIISTDELPSTDVKCRVLYGELDHTVEFEAYNRREIKKLMLVFENKINYNYKTIQRPELDHLFYLKEDADEILIVKNNLITDAYYYNIVLEKNGNYHSPKKSLLPGVMRQSLITSGDIVLKNIEVSKIWDYQHLHLINALNPLGKIRLRIEDAIVQ